MPQSGWLINNRHVFLTVVEVGKFKIKAPADSVSGEVLLPKWLYSPCVLTWQKG